MIPDLLYKMAFASVRGMGVDLAQKILDVLGDEKEFFAISASSPKARAKFWSVHTAIPALKKRKRKLSL